MEKNAIIRGRLIDLLDVLDARATINIYVEDKPLSVKNLRVFEFLSEPELMRKYKNYEVSGLRLGLTTDIMIKEA